MLPVGVGLSAVLLLEPGVGVAVAGFRVWPDGVEFVVTLQLSRRDLSLRQPPIADDAPQPPTGRAADPRLYQFHHLLARPTLTPRRYADLPRAAAVTVRFADSGEGTSADWWTPLDDTQHPSAPVIGVRSQVSHGPTHEFTLYVSPLPPPGPLVLGFSWPGADIGPGHITLHADPLRIAAAHARRL